MRFGGVIAAAGMSSRMGEFKPLMEINGIPMVRMAVQSLKNAGITDICVVTGRNSEEVKVSLRGMGVSFVRNNAYETTDMFASVCLGLKEEMSCDAVFVLPGDVPLVSPNTVKMIKTAAGVSEADVLVPVYRGQSAHPPVIMNKAVKRVLDYRGDGGLRGALSGLFIENVEIDDEYALSDADYMRDMEKLRAAAKARCGVSEAVCRRLYEKAALLENIIAHCEAVAALSRHIAERLIEHGYALDVELCYSGGMLHDIKRTEPRHSLAGAEFLRAEGYDALAYITENHAAFFQNVTPEFAEWSVVNLADKLLKSTTRVTVQERYALPLIKFADDKPLIKRIRTDIRVAGELCRRYREITGEDLEAV